MTETRPTDAAQPSASDLAHRARRLADDRGARVLIGIVGAPGAGKSTLAEELVAELGERAALVPMDGFHYSQHVLGLLGRADRKGAPDTFDAEGLAALLARIRTAIGPVYAPTFDRSIEEPIAAGTVVPAGADIVVVEGNYLLLDDGPWASLRELLDEVWFIRIPQDERMRRLVERHMRFGRTREAAEAWVDDVDEPNARLIEASAGRADVTLQL
ncbi:MAG: nucleoside/nucleotide kinase family protein [Microbacteriaceae bacterium]|nr:MAG: nucleoside/nucleotide kinase family protein [Microbacteriaceae bacterium]